MQVSGRFQENRHTPFFGSWRAPHFRARSRKSKLRASLSLSLKQAVKMANPLSMTEEDLKMMLAAKVYLGTNNINPNIRRYAWKRSNTGE